MKSRSWITLGASLAGVALLAGLTWLQVRIVSANDAHALSDAAGRADHALTEELRLRVTLVESLRAYLMASDQFPDSAAFAFYTGQVMENFPRIRALQYADADAVIRYIHPVEGNEAALGLALLESRFADQVEAIIARGDTGIDGPLETVQGSLSIIVRAPMFEDGTFQGLAQGVFDVEHIYDDIAALIPKEMRLALYDAGGARVHGPELDPAYAVLAPSGFRDSGWRVGLDWAAGPRGYDGLTMFLLWALGIPIFAGMVYGLHQRMHQTERLHTLVAERTAALEDQNAALAREVREREAAEASLRDTEAKFVQLAENISEVFWLRTRDKVLYMSPRFDVVFGRSREALFEDQQTFYDMVHPGDLEEMLPEWQATLEAGGTYSGEYRIIRPDGEVRWVWMRERPFGKDADGAYRLAGVGADVTERRAAQDALVASEERFRMLFEHAPVALIVPDVAPVFALMDQWREESGAALAEILEAHPDRILDLVRALGVKQANAQALRLFGAEDFTGLAAHVPEAQTEPAMALYKRLLCGEEREQFLYDFFVTLKRVDGELIEVWIKIYATAADDQGASDRSQLLVALTDITERARSESRLRESEARYRMLAEHASDMISRLDATGRFAYVSPISEDMLGYGQDALIGREHAELVHPEDLPAVRTCHAAILGAGGPHTVNYRLRRRTGEYVWVETTARAVPPADGAPGPGEVLCITRDVSERRAAEEERLRLSTAVDQAAEMIVITDKEGRIQYVNPSFERLTGYALEEVLGATPAILRSGEHDEAFYRRLWETINRGDVWRGTLVNRRKDGGLFQEECAISPIRDASGAIISFVAVKRDVSAELRLEMQLRQAQKMEAIGTLAGGIAHDFNNILAAIQGYAEMALHAVDGNASAARDMKQVLAASARARDLVQQILTFSRQTEQNLQPCAMNVVVQDALKLLRATVPTSIKFTVDLDPVAGHVLGDPSQLHQVVMNLCTNAWQAMRERGHGTLFVQTAHERVESGEADEILGLEPGAYVVLRVTDDGPGIPPETRDRIFDPFFTTKAPGEGTGLGLATVHGIVTDHGGVITVESDPGAGSTFRVYFPQVEGGAAPEGMQVIETPSGGGQRVLVIDDEPNLALLVQRMLGLLGYETDAFGSSVEAWKHLEEHPARYDAVLTDLTMPELTGRDLARRLRALRPELPVILMTGFSEGLTESEIDAVGIRAMLKKPFGREDLAHCLRRVLGDGPG